MVVIAGSQRAEAPQGGIGVYPGLSGLHSDNLLHSKTVTKLRKRASALQRQTFRFWLEKLLGLPSTEGEVESQPLAIGLTGYRTVILGSKILDLREM